MIGYNMKYEVNQIKAARTNMFDLPTWLKIRTKPKHQHCSNCGVDYSTLSDSGIGVIQLAALIDEQVIHVCNSCANHFIENGAIDILKLDTENAARKQAIIEVLKTEFNVRERDIHLEYSVDWFETHLKQLQTERDKQQEQSIKRLQLLPIKTQDALKYICKATNISLVDLFFEDYVFEIFSEYSIVYKTWDDRWLQNLEVGGKIGKRHFKWQWAKTTGDSSLRDMDWEFDFETLEEIESWETISDTEVLNWLGENDNHLMVMEYDSTSMSIQEYLKRLVVENG